MARESLTRDEPLKYPQVFARGTFFGNPAIVVSGNARSSEGGLESAAMEHVQAGLCIIALVVCCCLCVGCGITPNVGLAERCADIMRRAYPSATIDITKREASATSLTTIIASVEGVRTDIAPDGPSPRDLAVECRFDENILTSFRWTAGPTR